MAVTFVDNVLRITSAVGEQHIASNDIQAGGFDQLRVKKIRWVVLSATSGDNAQILDNTSGTVIWESVANATAPFVDESDYDQGFDLRALRTGSGLRAIVDSGTLYLYLSGVR